MKTITKSDYKKIPYREEDHGNWFEEWQFHEGCNDWWYLTSLVHDVNDKERTFFLQYTLTLMNKPHGDQLATQIGVTDIKNKKRFFQVLPEAVVCDPVTGRVTTSTSDLKVKPEDYSMNMDCQASDFGFNIDLKSKKGPIWHADNGVLVMGDSFQPNQRTIYYTFTEMATSGYLYITDENGKEEKVEIEGATWFDKQYGPYSYDSIAPIWEWFSLRFFDDEEVMIFSFPNTKFVDASYHKKDGSRDNFNNLYYTPRRFVKNTGLDYSMEWDLHLPIKEKDYYIKPAMENHFHEQGIGYFEGPGYVYNKSGELVGLCCIELCPGARQVDCAPKVERKVELTADATIMDWFDHEEACKLLGEALNGSVEGQQLFWMINDAYKLIGFMKMRDLIELSQSLINESMLEDIAKKICKK